jgi:hypothetical protein
VLKSAVVVTIVNLVVLVNGQTTLPIRERDCKNGAVEAEMQAD